MLRPAYCLNGFTDHRLADAVRLLAGLGYRGVAITAGPPHLDVPEPPWPDRIARGLAEARGILRAHGCSVVLETGGRYWLDAERKHHPTLVSPDRSGRRLRRRALCAAAAAAGLLGSPIVHCWAGAAEPGTDPAAAWAWLVEGVRELCIVAAKAGVVVGFEPEPGHVVESFDHWERLHHEVGHRALKLTVDLGHVVCVEPPPWPAALARVARDVVHVQVDDMRPGAHVHLPFGEGEVPLAAMLRVLADAGYGGQLAVELPRHSHEAPVQAARAIEALRAAAGEAGVELA